MEQKKIIKISVITAIIFLIISSTPIFNLVGSILNLDYENQDDSHRELLLVIHAGVTGLLMFVILKYCGSMCGVN